VNYEKLCQLRDELYKVKGAISKPALERYEQSFDVEFAHNSTAIEGNTISLIEAKTILEDKISVGGKPIREIYEIINHHKAFSFLKKCIEEKKSLSESIVKDIHALLMENILVGGVYRNVSVRIVGAGHKPLAPQEMFFQIKDFFETLSCKEANHNVVELAAYSHAEFVKIHPFEDGNGRTSRLIMNYQLMAGGFLPVSIPKEKRLDYFVALEEYAVNGRLEPFADMVFALEYNALQEFLALASPMSASDTKR
jgi:Fic family protein